MNKYFAALIISIFFSFQGKTQNISNPANAEPKSTFEVNINGKKYEIAENEELILDTLLKPKISIKLSEHKKFDNSNISFEYPRNMSFEFSQDTGYKNWTLSGNTLVVMIFEIDANTTLSTLTKAMIKKFGEENCTVEDFQKELGNKKYNGKKLHVTLAGQTLVLECYEIKTSEFKSRFIYFQDTIENNQHSKEFEDAFKLINSTIVFQ